MSQDPFLKNQKANQKGYDTWSTFYDNYPNPTVAIDDLSFPPFWQHIEGKSVLEIGCGTGRHTQKLLKKNNKVTGVDLSEGMLAVARKKNSQGDVQFIQADFLSFDFKGKLFDFILCSLVIEHITDLVLFFQKAKNCLKPKGRLYISEIHPQRSSQGVMAHFKTDDGNEIHLESVPHTERDFESAAESAGLKTVLKETIVGTDELVKINAKWAKHLNAPLVQVWIFQND